MICCDCTCITEVFVQHKNKKNQPQKRVDSKCIFNHYVQYIFDIPNVLKQGRTKI